MNLNTINPRQQAIQTARRVIAQNPIFLDTETTGLEINDEIIEISAVDIAGQVIFSSLVRPSQPIPASATQIHGITIEMVEKSSIWPIVWQRIRPMLLGKLIVAYNSEFDFRMMQQSHSRYRLPWRDPLSFFDLLKLHSQFRGEWNAQRRSWRYFSLEQAGKMADIPLPNAHRSTDDALLTRALLLFIADST